MTGLREDAVGLLARGYGLGPHVWRRVREGARAAPMRLLGRDAVLVRGAEGVELFYDESRIARHGAMPAIVQESLFGHGSVHSLDGHAHRHRKATFVDVAYDDRQVRRYVPLLEREWSAQRDAWASGGRQSAYDAASGAFGRSVMEWAGLPGTAAARTRWSRRLAQIVDGFGAPYAPGYLLTRANRWWSDRHAERLIVAARSGILRPAPETALRAWADHRGIDGELLSARLAGIELQNSMRPMIAVARFVVQFAQEVRRTAPFVPMLPGWARTGIEVDGQRVDAGGRVLLDILGTDTDPASWTRPDVFDPDRFADQEDYEALAAFIPHGGAGVATGHRCPGEKLAIAGLSAAIAVLSDPRLEIDSRALGVNRRRLPTMPASGARVHRRGEARRPRASSRGRSGGCPFH